VSKAVENLDHVDDEESTLDATATPNVEPVSHRRAARGAV